MLTVYYQESMKRQLGELRRVWEENIKKTDLQEIVERCRLDSVGLV
jgi:hypothetical protein